MIRAAATLIAAVALGGCAVTTPPGDETTPSFTIADLAKTDVDAVLELHLDESRALLAALMEKLYRRNPDAWRDAGHPSAQHMVARVFRPPSVPAFRDLGGRRGTAAVRLAFEPGYRGDRVLAFIAGLASMIDRAYDGKRRLFALDRLDPQKLYHAARNLEVAAWLLRTRVREDGRPWLLSHSFSGEDANLSFERLIGKLIATQDMAARIVAGKTRRTIRGVVHRMAGMVFLPI